MKIKTIITTILIILIGYTNCIYSQNANTKIMPPEQYVVLAREYAKEGESEKLNELMADMLEKYPDNPDALNYRGSFLLMEYNLDEAEKVIKYAIEKNPSSDELYLTLGDIYYTKGDLGLAERNFNKAIEINPDSKAHANLGYLYAKQKKYKEAIEELKLFLRNRKGSDRLQKKMGDIYYALGKYKPAVAAYQKSIDYGGSMHDINKLLGLAKSYEALGDYYHAEIAYDELMKHHKFDKDAREPYNKFKKKLNK